MSTPSLRARPGAGREVAVTFDDLPVISVVHGDVETHRDITTRLLEGLVAHEIPAIGFVNERKLRSQDALDPAGAYCKYDNFAAGLLELVGVDPDPWVPGVVPWRGAKV